ncbi:tetratricopeptide repeat protein [Cylindrospermum sp. FACHB-282]|uniref:tetratricopeptide repeat protein n=1 Tax=Cylindrospermum sp. FACHB-282 TaxID=2692794 RepID=UPI001689F20C|nr:tetratricopeptide repeat protein [Cylindrospermum sp. FACHB-282]MBD2384528.1 tetratricopeptide repeat protein [Cylindrospermum sp. FACHB-282]
MNNPKSLTPWQRRQLEERQNTFLKEWELLSQKIKDIRLDLAIEAGTTVKFQLKQQLQEEEAKQKQLEVELDEIEQKLNQEAVSTSKNPLPVPAKSNNLSLSTYNSKTWVGRDALITELTERLEEKCRILALTGITGIGKTALAERLVVEIHRNGLQFHRLNFDDRGQGTDFISGALSLLPKLGETVTLEDQKDPQNALKHLLQTLRNNKFLVQIDSVEMLLQGDDESGWNAFVDNLWVEFFHQLLAGGECQSQILLTTQALSEKLEIEGSSYPNYWYRQDLGGLSAAEQLQLFEKNGLKPDELGTEILKRIGNLYEGHPLVIQVIAKDILDKPFYGNVQKYWQRYQAEFDEDERRKQKSTSSRKLQLLVKERVKKSLQRLPSDAYQMLCCSSVYRRPVPEGFWLAMLAEDKQDNALELLKSHHLAEEELRDDGVLLLRQHNLVRQVTRSLLRTDAALWRETERTAARLWLNEYEPEPDAPYLEKVRGSLEAFHHYCEVEDWKVAKAILIDQKVGDQLLGWGEYREMLPLYEQLLGKLDAAVDVVCEKGIGNAYRNLGNYPQAIEHYQQSLATAREISDRKGEGNALGGLGIVYKSLGKYHQAIDYLQQCLTIVREIGYRRGEGLAMGNLGNVYNSLGNYPQAIKYHQQDLTIACELGDIQGKGRAMGNLGNVYVSLGNYHQAIDYLQECLTIAREIGNRRGEGISLCNLGNVYETLGNYSQAIDYLQQSLTTVREIPDRQGEAIALVNWGKTLLKLEQYPEAQQRLQTSLDIFKELGERRSEAEALLRLGELHHKTGQLDLAREFYAQAHSLASVLGIPLLKECEELQGMLAADAAADIP